MKSRKGFTLIELLAVIVILVIISLIAVNAVQRMITNNKEKSYEAKLDIILKQAKQYAKDNDNFLQNSSRRYLGKVCNLITVGELRTAGYLKEITNNGSNSAHIINPVTGESMDNLQIAIYINSNNFRDGVEKFSGTLVSTMTNIILCTTLRPYPTEIFTYTGYEQEFTATRPGFYKLQVWGAEGGYVSTSYVVMGSNTSGKGGYAEGLIYLNAGEKIYVYVGGSGNTGGLAGGWNGGGAGITLPGGGGATDMRIEGNTLYHRIIVAGGGGSSNTNDFWGQGCKGGGGGGLVGITCSWGSASGGSQIQGGSSAAGFGYGEPARDGNSGGRNGSGGGGWYGGAAGSIDGSTPWMAHSCGAGGSGFVYTGANIVPSGYAVNNHVLIKTKILRADSTKMPSYDGLSKISGNTGDGYAVITFVGNDD